MHQFGFGSPTGVDLPGEDGGIILPVSQYSGSSMGNLPFGQGESVTPIQIATAYAAIANGGILRPPHIVASIGGKADGAPGRPPDPLRARPRLELRKMLIGVFGDGGTASGAAIPGYDMAGKTGTANIASTATTRAPSSSPRSSAWSRPTTPSSWSRSSSTSPRDRSTVARSPRRRSRRSSGWAVPYFGISPR